MLDRRSRAALQTLLPGACRTRLHKGIFEAGFERFYEDFQTSAPRKLRWGLRLSLWAAVWVSPLLIGRVPPLTLHEPATREKALAAMERSRLYVLRQFVHWLKMTASLCYGADPDVREAVGYPRQPGRAEPWVHAD